VSQTASCQNWKCLRSAGGNRSRRGRPQSARARRCVARQSLGPVKGSRDQMPRRTCPKI